MLTTDERKEERAGEEDRKIIEDREEGTTGEQEDKNVGPDEEW